MKKAFWIVLVAAAVLLTSEAAASAIKVWVSGETLTASDLNSALSHIHSAAEASITNTRISAGAAIAHSKLATPALLPKAWATVSDGASAACTGAGPTACTLDASSGVTSVSNTAAGVYLITWSAARSNANYAIVVSPGTTNRIARVQTQSTTTAEVRCIDTATVDADCKFSFIMMDNDN